jgi:hypothetical protein
MGANIVLSLYSYTVCVFIIKNAYDEEVQARWPRLAHARSLGGPQLYDSSLEDPSLEDPSLCDEEVPSLHDVEVVQLGVQYVYSSFFVLLYLFIIVLSLLATFL